jgi:hypothetical protein
MFLKVTTHQENSQALPLSKFTNFTCIFSALTKREFNNHKLLYKHHSTNTHNTIEDQSNNRHPKSAHQISKDTFQDLNLASTKQSPKNPTQISYGHSHQESPKIIIIMSIN